MTDNSAGEPGFDQINVSLPVLARVVYRYKWALAGWLIVALGLGTIYVLVVPPTYQVTSRVVVEPEGSPLGDRRSSRNEEEFLATQGEIIRSPAVVERAIATMETPLAIDPDSDPVLSVLNNLAVKPLTGTNVLSVAYQCKDSEEGISLVHAVLESYQQFLRERDDGSRLETLHLLTRSEQQLRRELEQREQRYRELRKQSPLIGQGKDGTALQAGILEKLGQALAEEKSRRIDHQNRLALLEQTAKIGFVDDHRKQDLAAAGFHVADGERRVELANWVMLVGNDPLPPAFQARSENLALDLIADVKLTGTPNSSDIFEELYRAEVRQKELAQSCGPDHPEMRSAQEKIAAWKDQLRVLVSQAPIALQREIDAAHSREKQLTELYNKELENAKSNGDFLIIEKQELDGIERLKTIHSSLVAQLNDWRLVKPDDDSSRGTKMSIIEAPSIGTGPIWPNPKLLLALFSAIGLLAGVGTVLVLEREMLAN